MEKYKFYKSTSILTAILSINILISCKSASNPDYKITIRNDILDKEFNIVEIDGIITNRGQTSIKQSLSPGSEYNIPAKEISKITLSRKYSDHTKLYEVQCPTNLKSQIVMKLIDIHLNRVSGGCKLTKKGEKSSKGLTKWE